MSVKMKSVTATNRKEILAIPDHYVALAFKHAQATSSSAGLAELVGGRYIVKAGTIYPANDKTAIGVVLNDYDVTDGDAQMAVAIHGFVRADRLPADPEEEAIAALPMIKFVAEDDEFNFAASVQVVNKAINDELYEPKASADTGSGVSA